MKRAPSYKNAPSAMNPAAMDIWKFVVKRYADDIYESKSMRDQWRKAKSHFGRVCAQKGISPYEPLTGLAVRLERLSRSL